MTIKERIISKVHSIYCGTEPAGPEAGCCGCAIPVADVYVTVGCEHCRAPGETYCWACVDDQDGWHDGMTLADFTVYPGRERP
jgi:hypothetical protein